MKLPDIQAWLASEQDFKQGVALYAALGQNPVYQRLFTLGATDYSRRVLLRELSSLVAPGRDTIAVAVHELTALVSEINKGGEVVAELVPPIALPAASVPGVDSPLLADVRQQLKAARDERSHLHPQLTAKNLGKKARLVLALRIVALTSQEVKLKAQEAHVQQHGRLPGPVATAEVTDEAELRQRLLNLRSRRSKLKGKPEQAEKLAAIEAEIALIQSKLTNE